MGRPRIAAANTSARTSSRRRVTPTSSFDRRSHLAGTGVASSRGRTKNMPEAATLERARKAKRSGKAPSTQAGEFVREEIHHIREGKHGARSAKQAIAIGLSKARRSGVKLPRPPASAKSSTKRSAAAATRAGHRRRKPSAKRARASLRKLKREGRAAASTVALARQARISARRRSAADRRAAGRRAARTKGLARRREAAKKAARTRKRQSTSRRRRATA